MDLLKKFDTQASYDAIKDSLEYPTVSYVTENDLVYFMQPSLYEWVDLGLSVKWAAWNVGATKPEEYGLYFAWGETKGYTGITDTKRFTWSDYELCNGSSSTLIKYNNNSSYGTVDNILELESSDDAASATQSTCRMPISDECQELIDNTTTAWTTDYNGSGVSGVILTSKVEGYTDKSIFLPTAGQCGDGYINQTTTHGFYWSSSLTKGDTYYAFYFGFNPANVFLGESMTRVSGFSVRAILDK